jgi:hypothetical protein
MARESKEEKAARLVKESKAAARQARKDKKAAAEATAAKAAKKGAKVEAPVAKGKKAKAEPALTAREQRKADKAAAAKAPAGAVKTKKVKAASSATNVDVVVSALNIPVRELSGILQSLSTTEVGLLYAKPRSSKGIFKKIPMSLILGITGGVEGEHGTVYFKGLSEVINTSGESKIDKATGLLRVIDKRVM